jgi:transcriptional regulator
MRCAVELFQGTLDMLILRALRPGPLHGYAAMRRIREVSGDELRINEGALYPALHRMEERGWVDAEWGLTDGNRQAKFYRLTPLGRSQLDAETENWHRYVAAVARVLQEA